jgi:fluoride exporter
MRVIWYVALGGAVGSVVRYIVGLAVQSRNGVDFPVGTLLVNLSGCLLLGFLIHYALAAPAITPELRALLTTGLCGGYTTFSTFSYETVTLMQDGDWRRATLMLDLVWRDPSLPSCSALPVPGRSWISGKGSRRPICMGSGVSAP